jgi:hypothetical protein
MDKYISNSIHILLTNSYACQLSNDLDNLGTGQEGLSRKLNCLSKKLHLILECYKGEQREDTEDTPDFPSCTSKWP